MDENLQVKIDEKLKDFMALAKKKKKTASVYIWRRISAILIFAAVVTGIVLSLTVFFNIENIEVRGSLEIYTKQEVSNASGLRKGDNIFRFSAYNTKNKIMRELPYISEVIIKRYLPSSMLPGSTWGPPPMRLISSSLAPWKWTRRLM